jgi:hypothetical protein
MRAQAHLRRTLAGWSVITALVFSVAGSAITDAPAFPTESLTPRMGCPRGLSGYTTRGLTLEQALEAARQIVARGYEDNQGRHEKRTRANQEVIAVSRTGPLAPSGRRLYDAARRRCGRTAAELAWAVTFHNSLSVICCSKYTVFVVATTKAVFVFGGIPRR